MERLNMSWIQSVSIFKSEADFDLLGLWLWPLPEKRPLVCVKSLRMLLYVVEQMFSLFFLPTVRKVKYTP